MERNDHWLISTAVALAIVTLIGNFCHVTPPNIVYILVDDLGYEDVSCLNPGRGKVATPHFDQFAKQGMTVKDAHSGSSVCTPTR